MNGTQQTFGHWRHPGAMPFAGPRSEPYWLFALFALYGPSIRLIGEFRYVEIVVLGALAIYLGRALPSLNKWEKRFVVLFCVTAVMQVISDFVNSAELQGTLKRSFTYVILALLVVGIKVLSRGDLKRLRWILAGYFFSYFVALYIGQGGSQNYDVLPWRLGLGVAVTLGICLLPFWLSWTYLFVGPALILLSAVHLFEGARTLAVITAGCGILIALGYVFRSYKLRRFKVFGAMVVLLVGIFSGLAVYNAAVWATDRHLLPGELQHRMEEQLSNPYGLIAAARPDTMAALYGISMRPILGFGSTNVDPNVYSYYVQVAASTYAYRGNFDDFVKLNAQKEWELGTPSHSHVFGAWVDAGIIAAICWIAYIYLAFHVLYRTALWHHPFAPLFLTVAAFCIWDTLFSPGPHRMDVAIRLSILIAAVEMMDRISFISKRSIPGRGTAPNHLARMG